MPASPKYHHDSIFRPLPAAEPMSRTDSGFEEYPRQRKPAQPQESDQHAATPFSDAHLFEEEISVDTPVDPITPQTDSCLDALHQLESRPPISPSISSDRPVLRKRRSRPSSKHSAKSSTRSSGAYQRPSFSSRVRSFPDYPLPHGDIDEVLALHTRSCNLFQSFSVPSSAPQSPSLAVVRCSADFPRLQIDANAAASPIATSHPFSIHSSAVSTHSRMDEAAEDAESHHEPAPTPVPATVIHWNSPNTRRREYAEIDKSTKGFRGFLRRVMPRWLGGKPPRQPFYDDEKNADDACSVRRYRIDVPEEDDMMSTRTRERQRERERPRSAGQKLARVFSSCY